MDCYIVNLSHLRRDQPYVTVWRPDHRGYAWPLSWAGRYSEEAVRATPDYYNCGDSNIAVPCGILDQLAVPPKPGAIDNDAGPVVLSTAENWRQLIANVIAPTKYVPQPEYRGAPRRRKARAALAG
jgi:hypothetical protein